MRGLHVETRATGAISSGEGYLVFDTLRDNLPLRDRPANRVPVSQRLPDGTLNDQLSRFGSQSPRMVSRLENVVRYLAARRRSVLARLSGPS